MTPEVDGSSLPGTRGAAWCHASSSPALLGQGSGRDTALHDLQAERVRSLFWLQVRARTRARTRAGDVSVYISQQKLWGSRSGWKPLVGPALRPRLPVVGPRTVDHGRDGPCRVMGRGSSAFFRLKTRGNTLQVPLCVEDDSSIRVFKNGK
ncbi:uncharacterized protein V6R79_017467 [Siganus canaliculatus]